MVEQRVLLGIRPEHVTLSEAPGSLRVTAKIDRIEQLGAASFLYCTLSRGERLTVHAPGQVGYAGESRYREPARERDASLRRHRSRDGARAPL
jgi:ABC-type sugar transport system ATPase subunit